MNALLVAPKFFSYEHELQAELQQLGYFVDFLPDSPFNDPAMKALLRFTNGAFLFIANRFYEESISRFGRSRYDLILIVKGIGISAETILFLRENYPQAKQIYYTWDNFRNKPKYCVDNLIFYDNASTFDQVDANAYDLKYRPLFFSEKFESLINIKQSFYSEDIDLSFVGTVHSDRLSVIKSVEKSLSRTDANIYTYLYLQAEWVYYLRSVFSKEIREKKKTDFKYSALEKEVLQNIFRRSKAVLDIEHPQQSGMTMRTFETLGAGKKLVTTNRSVFDAEFYSPDNVLVIDRNNSSGVGIDFLRAPSSPVPAEIKKKYSLQYWLKEVIDY